MSVDKEFNSSLGGRFRFRCSENVSLIWNKRSLIQKPAYRLIPFLYNFTVYWYGFLEQKGKKIITFLLDIFFIYISNFIPFPHFPSNSSHPISPLPAHWPTYSCFPVHSPTLGHLAFIRPRASLLIDVPQSHPLLYMWLEPWVPPCVLFVWWFIPRELWGYWLVHVVVPPIGLQNSSTPWVCSLAPPLGTLCSGQWMTVSNYFCDC